MRGDASRTDAMASGFALAEAWLEGSTVGRVREVLRRDFASRVEEASARVTPTGEKARLEALRRLARSLRDGPDPARAERLLPRRALTLLATSVPREVGRRWIAAAPAHRPGFRPPAGLLAYLRHLGADAAAEAGPWPA